MSKMRKKSIYLVLFLMLMPYSTFAADLNIGTKTELAIDPHYGFLSSNIEFSQHLFDALIKKDNNSNPTPGLALSWELIDETTWEFKLRQNVKFHDGNPFTAKDVAFTIERIPNIPGNPNPYNPLIRSIAEVKLVDDYTLRFITKSPDVELPSSLGSVYIVSHIAAKDAGPEDFKSGKAAIGTGPYRFSEYKPGQYVALKRNPGYWGAKEPWETVTFHFLSNDATSIAALRSGKVDVIAELEYNNVPSLRKNPKINVFERPGENIRYIIMDGGRTNSPEIKALDGGDIDNPLKKLEVRRALSQAIDRKAIVKAVLEGEGTPANQLVPPGIVGHSVDIPAAETDLDQAKKILADAGYAKGFSITLRGPNDRYGNGKPLQAIAQMWSRLGLKVQVYVEPTSTYFPKIKRATGVKYSAMMMGWTFSESNECPPFFNTVLHSYSAEKNYGPANRAYFDDPVFDNLLETAQKEMNTEKRAKLLKEMVEYVTAQYVALPLYYENSIVAARKGLDVQVRPDEAVYAMNIRQK